MTTASPLCPPRRSVLRVTPDPSCSNWRTRYDAVSSLAHSAGTLSVRVYDCHFCFIVVLLNALLNALRSCCRCAVLFSQFSPLLLAPFLDRFECLPHGVLADVRVVLHHFAGDLSCDRLDDEFRLTSLQ